MINMYRKNLFISKKYEDGSYRIREFKNSGTDAKLVIAFDKIIEYDNKYEIMLLGNKILELEKNKYRLNNLYNVETSDYIYKVK